MLFLALRYLSSRRRQTLLTLLGIVLGTTAYVVISGMMIGFQAFIIDQLVNNDSHIRIAAREDVLDEHELDAAFYGGDTMAAWLSPPSGRKDAAHIEDVQGWYSRLNADKRVKAYSPQLTTQVLIKRAKIAESARLIGSDTRRQEQVTTIGEYMTIGKFSDVGTSGNRIVIGDGLAKKLGTRVGETVSITSGSGIPVPFRIVGMFHLGLKNIDDATIFGALSDVQKVAQMPGLVSDIALRLNDVANAGLIASAWADLSPDKVQSWDQANANFLSVFRTQDLIRNFMTLSILLVAGFGIYNILNMTINQKRREIAILRSIGYDGKDIVVLFLIQGILLGTIGGLIGMTLGYAACRFIETIPVNPDRLASKSGGMLISYVPWIYMRGFALAFVSATVAGYFPARAASKLTPIDIIRTEGA